MSTADQQFRDPGKLPAKPRKRNSARLRAHTKKERARHAEKFYDARRKARDDARRKARDGDERAAWF